MTTSNWSHFNTKGPKPGSDRAISQRKAMSEGYAAAKSPRCVKTNQQAGSTGKSSAPGLTSRPRKG